MQVSPMFRYPRELLGFKALRIHRHPAAPALTKADTSTIPAISLVIDPEKNLENLTAISPLFHADKIVKPLIVLQGANDPRVIKPESDEIVDNIKKRNGVVEYVLFDNEGHGFTKKANEIKAYKSILDFLDRYLKNGDAMSSR